MSVFAVVLAVAIAVAAGPALGHGSSGHEPTVFDASTVEQKAFGRAGDPKVASRTMRISMSDTMRFSPAVLTIRKGETVRFVVRNDGKALHEMVLGTDEELAQHAELMRRFPNMEHDEQHMVHVRPGQSGDLVWTFNRPGEFRFACLVPGHYEAGMVGKVVVR